MREPIVVANILVPSEHLGTDQACEERRGVQRDMQFVGRHLADLRVADERSGARF